MIRKIRNRYRYLKNELKHWYQGDKRDDFEKLVEKCRFLELERTIYNADIIE